MKATRVVSKGKAVRKSVRIIMFTKLILVVVGHHSAEAKAVPRTWRWFSPPQRETGTVVRLPPVFADGEVDEGLAIHVEVGSIP